MGKARKRGILVRFPVKDAELIKKAAEDSRLSQEEFCRRVLIDAAHRTIGRGRKDLLGMVRALYDLAVPNGELRAEEVAAMDALMQMGIGRMESLRAIRLIAQTEPDLKAAEIVTRALKPPE